MPAIPVARIVPFEPRPAWFVRHPAGIHGLGHEVRVLIWTQVLAAMVAEEGLTVDPVTLGWTAAVHDTQRLNDGIDADHGSRAAHWLRRRPFVLSAEASVEQIAYLCEWHVPPDHHAPEMTASLKVFKDADALDRWRIADLNPAFLRTRSAHRLLRPSHDLWARTRELEDGDSIFGDIIDAALRLGILQS
jgi:uncharacterized protein